jgi:hypothetical protein
MEDFGLIVATTESKLMINQLFVDQINEASFPVVIVNQAQDHPIPTGAFRNHVRVIESTSRGLSKSRNLALDCIQARFVMLCDDDIQLQPGCLDEVSKLLQPEVALFFTPLFTTEGKPWRANYASESFKFQGMSFQNRRRIQAINSMEQILNLDFMNAHGIRFNPAFGVGSGGHPMGEETLLCFSILKSGGVIQFLPVPTRIHPPASTSSNMTAEKYRAIGAVHRIVFAPIGRLVNIGYRLKLILKNNPLS